MEKDKVIKRLSLSEERCKTRSEKMINATAEVKKTHKLEREAMERKHAENMTKAENEREKEINAMEKRHSQEVERLNTKLSKKDRKLAKLKEKKKGQASAAQKRRWDNYSNAYAKVEASYKQSFENEVARLEAEHDRESKKMSKAADAERVRLVISLEEMQSDLKISREKQKEMAAEIRFYQDKEMREEEALEEESQARAESGSKDRSKDGDEEKIFDVDFHDEDKSNKWGVKMRKRIVKLLVIGVPPAQIGPTLRAVMDTNVILPSDRFMRQMRSEMRIIVETLAAYAAADPEVKSHHPKFCNQNC